MKVGLNATCLNDRPSGATQRFVGIYSELFKILPEIEFVIYESKDCSVGAWFNDSANISVRKSPIPSEGRLRKYTKGLWYWDRALRQEHLDLFEVFNLPVVTAPSGKTFLTIHDIRFLYPEWQGAERVAYRSILRNAIKKSDHIITVSAAMKNEILKFFPETSICIVPNGLDASLFEFISVSDLDEVRERLSLPEKFLLTVGHFENRKNYLRLISSFSLLLRMGHDISLIIVGNDSGMGNLLCKKIADDHLTQKVRLLSGLSDHDVRCLYKLSTLFVFASAYEGFGIPILEAMASRCPMILSNLPVFREITEEQAIYFPHDDIVAIANAMEIGLTSKDERRRLVHYGSRRIRDFSFEQLAKQVATIYGDLV
ncbi:MAG: glycosyltransferase family 1 protein [Candidatus Electrothrix sp. GW3-4]|uniref:glycosyltransferase family 4 protein n=1 Tax=Candidatus Electrothrix sp. GW3-4 TaxID=3126740 RepID=UPI0030CBE1E4